MVEEKDKTLVLAGDVSEHQYLRLMHASSDDLIDGGDDNDQIQGGAGADLIYGGAGNDEVHAGTGNDTVYGGSGKDRLYGNAGSDFFTSVSRQAMHKQSILIGLSHNVIINLIIFKIFYQRKHYRKHFCNFLFSASW